jgi:hypothetical protein
MNAMRFPVMLAHGQMLFGIIVLFILAGVTALVGYVVALILVGGWTPQNRRIILFLSGAVLLNVLLALLSLLITKMLY